MIIESVPTYINEYINSLERYQGGSTRSAVKNTDTSDWIDKLSSNECWMPSGLAVKAIKTHAHLVNEYNFQSDYSLRCALSAHMGGRMVPEQFITGNGGMEILDFVCRGLLTPGDESIISTPTFLAYKDFIKAPGGKVIDVPLDPETFEVDIDGILDAITERTRLIIITSPNNPTGTLITKAQMDKLVAGIPPHLVILYDEVYHDFVESNVSWPRAEHYIAAGKPVIGLHSFSKAYGLAGIRLGYAFSTPAIARYLYKLERPFLLNTLTTEAGMAALQDTKHLVKVKKVVEQGRLRLYDAFELLGLKYWYSHGNFILFQSPYEGEAFAGDMLDRGIMVRTGEVFAANGCIRVSIGEAAAVKRFIAALKGVLGR